MQPSLTLLSHAGLREECEQRRAPVGVWSMGKLWRTQEDLGMAGPEKVLSKHFYCGVGREAPDREKKHISKRSTNNISARKK